MRKITLEQALKIPKEQRLRITRIGDTFKERNAPREHYVDSRGEDRYKWSDEAYTEDYMIRSQNSGMLARYYAVMSDDSLQGLDSAILLSRPEMYSKVREQIKRGHINDVFDDIWTKATDEEKKEIANTKTSYMALADEINKIGIEEIITSPAGRIFVKLSEKGINYYKNNKWIHEKMPASSYVYQPLDNLLVKRGVNVSPILEAARIIGATQGTPVPPYAQWWKHLDKPKLAEWLAKELKVKHTIESQGLDLSPEPRAWLYDKRRDKNSLEAETAITTEVKPEATISSLANKHSPRAIVTNQDIPIRRIAAKKSKAGVKKAIVHQVSYSLDK